ncbi:hypothetical protein LJC01_01765 [Clostridiaceae bacterium OttesenSCG-928-D20]|nr:hypothetical protein [Clostridiaceae bacterium OttesenSCG-928-D20]
MKFLKKRPVAIILAIIIVIGSTVISAHRHIQKECQELEDCFYTGAYNEERGSIDASINSQIQVMLNSSLGVVSISSKYPQLEEQTEILRESRDNLNREGEISSKYQPYSVLIDDFAILVSSLREIELSDSDSENLSSYVRKFEGAQNVIAKSTYNDNIRKFKREYLGSFPVNFLKHIAFVREPSLFE